MIPNTNSCVCMNCTKVLSSFVPLAGAGDDGGGAGGETEKGEYRYLDWTQTLACKKTGVCVCVCVCVSLLPHEGQVRRSWVDTDTK
jgi:hypothetical protein